MCAAPRTGISLVVNLGCCRHSHLNHPTQSRAVAHIYLNLPTAPFRSGCIMH